MAERTILGYWLYDTAAHCQVGKMYATDQRKVAAAKRDRLDSKYGAVRYIVKPVYSEVYDGTHND